MIHAVSDARGGRTARVDDLGRVTMNIIAA